MTAGRRNKSRNWPLVVTACLVILINIAIISVVALNLSVVGWWAAVIVPVSGVSIGLAIMAIMKNDPALLLLDVILPG